MPTTYPRPRRNAETFDRAYVEKLRTEARNLRTRAQVAEAKLAALRTRAEATEAKLAALQSEFQPEFNRIIEDRLARQRNRLTAQAAAVETELRAALTDSTRRLVELERENAALAAEVERLTREGLQLDRLRSSVLKGLPDHD